MREVQPADHARAPVQPVRERELGEESSTSSWLAIWVIIIVCERTKASWQTMTGIRIRWSSASRKASSSVSCTSWLFSQ